MLVFIHFLQDNRLTTRTLLKRKGRATLHTDIVRSDLTEQRYALFQSTYRRWSAGIERGKRQPEDVELLNKALARLRGVAYEPVVSSVRPRKADSAYKQSASEAKLEDIVEIPDDFELTAEELADFEASGPHFWDKADWHSDGEFPGAYVYAGMFIAWLLENKLMTSPFSNDLRYIRRKKLTGAKLYRQWDGALDADMLTEEGNDFARDYFVPSKRSRRLPQYSDDYEALLIKTLPSPYQVRDSWENYRIIRERISQRYRAWKEKRGRDLQTRSRRQRSNPRSARKS